MGKKVDLVIYGNGNREVIGHADLGENGSAHLTIPTEVGRRLGLFDEGPFSFGFMAERKEIVTQHVETARQLIFEYIEARLEKTDKHVKFTLDQVYAVWFAKVLQNWKALISTELPDGMYYEVTYNDYNNEIYIDAYKKFDNVKIAMGEDSTPNPLGLDKPEGIIRDGSGTVMEPNWPRGGFETPGKIDSVSGGC